MIQLFKYVGKEEGSRKGPKREGDPKWGAGVSVNVAFDIFLILFAFLVYTWQQLGYIKDSQSLMKLLYTHVAYGTLRNVAYGTPN